MRSTLTASALVLLAACAEPSIPGPVPDEGEDPGMCGASDYSGMVGTNVAAVSLPADLNARIIGPDTIVTQDYIPTRINFATDRQGVIRRVYCG